MPVSAEAPKQHLFFTACREEAPFLAGLSLLAFGLFASNYNGLLKSYNSTIYALNYGYGFLSRGLIGSLYAALDALLPVSMLSYRAAVLFTLAVTFLFFLFLLAFSAVTLARIPREDRTPARVLLILLFLFLIPTFSCEFNLGRVDLYMIALSLAGVCLLVHDRFLWLLIPAVCAAVMVHQGYVFMYLNLILVLLFVRWMRSEKGRGQFRYAGLFCLVLLCASALFLYFELFSHGGGEEVWEEVVARATALSLDGEYHETLLAHEILGVDLTESEWSLHRINLVEFPVFLVLFAPYIAMLFRVLSGYLSGASERRERLARLAVCAGALTMLPDFLLKLDYGRWVLAVVVYELVILLSLSAMGDLSVRKALSVELARFRSRPLGAVLLVYPLLFVPLWDVYINKLLTTLFSLINDHFLGW